jgi:hypothetical protein
VKLNTLIYQANCNLRLVLDREQGEGRAHQSRQQ